MQGLTHWVSGDQAFWSLSLNGVQGLTSLLAPSISVSLSVRDSPLGAHTDTSLFLRGVLANKVSGLKQQLSRTTPLLPGDCAPRGSGTNRCRITCAERFRENESGDDLSTTVSDRHRFRRFYDLIRPGFARLLSEGGLSHALSGSVTIRVVAHEPEQSIGCRCVAVPMHGGASFL